jgi:hypothetical protein
MTEKSARGLARGWRRGRGVGGTRHDAYRPRTKLPEPAVCQKCGAVWHKGRWTWDRVPKGAQEHTCPACLRIAEKQPAGRLRLEGDFTGLKREILRLVRNQEEAETAQHPLERLMGVDQEPWGISITTTGIHLARRIAEALRRTYHERVQIRYLKAQDLVRVVWRHAPEAAPAKRAKRRASRS